MTLTKIYLIFSMTIGVILTKFIAKLAKVVNARKEYASDAKLSFEKICDPIFLSDEELDTYCTTHNIPF